jgi:2-oxoisovalerate dehydrogenase E1 component alpha subunit
MKQDSPINRFRKYVEAKGWWSESEDSAFKKEIRTEILQAFAKAEKRKKPSVDELFTDVYDELPWHLKEQQAELKEMMKKYPEQYDTSGYAPSKSA